MSKRIVQSLGDFVKNVVPLALQGIEVETSEYGANIMEELSLLETAEAIKRLLAIDNGVGARTRFTIGDFYRASPKKHSVRDLLAKIIYGPGVTPNQKQLLRTYGWVAGKWPIEKRTDQHNWSWYLTHKPAPSGEVVEEPKKKVSLDIVDIEQDGDYTVLDLGKAGRKQGFTLLITDADMRRIMEKRRHDPMETSPLDSFFDLEEAVA